ncbi:unnamed protein product [Vicia faba]|uniref:Uncharacterized protein n=1 Tax=Vicia faba TaxID=3906 RepID=A0AAV1AYY7_VICFA|nr:unnamed protein product [Vicia faba]
MACGQPKKKAVPTPSAVNVISPSSSTSQSIKEKNKEVLKSADVKPWVDIIKGNRLASNGLALKYIAPMVDTQVTAEENTGKVTAAEKSVAETNLETKIDHDKQKDSDEDPNPWTREKSTFKPYRELKFDDKGNPPMNCINGFGILGVGNAPQSMRL